MTNTQQLIAETCDSIKKMLLDKNMKYGDSALNPTRIFSKSSAVEQILVRIDDKLSRISKGAGLLASDEDVVNDLIGYLVLLKVANSKESALWDGTDIEPAAPCAVAKGTPYYFSNPVCYTDIVNFGNNSPEDTILTKAGSDEQDLLQIYASGDRFA